MASLFPSALSRHQPGALSVARLCRPAEQGYAHAEVCSPDHSDSPRKKRKCMHTRSCFSRMEYLTKWSLQVKMSGKISVCLIGNYPIRATRGICSRTVFIIFLKAV